jgi:hypothetical protein
MIVLYAADMVLSSWGVPAEARTPNEKAASRARADRRRDIQRFLINDGLIV